MPTIELLQIVQKSLTPELIALKNKKKSGTRSFAIAKAEFINAVSEKVLYFCDGVAKRVLLLKNSKGEYLVYELIGNAFDFAELQSRIACVEVPEDILKETNSKNLEELIEAFNASIENSSVRTFAKISIKKYFRVEKNCIEVCFL